MVGTGAAMWINIPLPPSVICQSAKVPLRENCVPESVSVPVAENDVGDDLARTIDVLTSSTRIANTVSHPNVSAFWSAMMMVSLFSVSVGYSSKVICIPSWSEPFRAALRSLVSVAPGQDVELMDSSANSSSVGMLLRSFSA